MQWEQLTSRAFAAAVRETGVCVIAMGVVERHGEHLPLGTDFLNAHRIACLAAEREPAVVFPPFYFGQIYEARCFPGTVTIAPTLLLDLIQGVFDEIGRNGFRKIVVYNGHGGNTHMLRFLAQCSLWEQKPYSLYIPLAHLTPEQTERWAEMRETTFGGHACEAESSVLMANYPALAHPERVPAEPAQPLDRMGHLPPTFAGVSWYANYPEHYAGDARPASAEKGRALVDWQAETLAQYIAAVKADEVVPALEGEFFRRAAQVG
ncbi:MAG: creatininase family protein [Anaerolineae bacterium]|nr:creatininase family protein [Anaerolineae bacterium]